MAAQVKQEPKDELASMPTHFPDVMAAKTWLRQLERKETDGQSYSEIGINKSNPARAFMSWQCGQDSGGATKCGRQIYLWVESDGTARFAKEWGHHGPQHDPQHAPPALDSHWRQITALRSNANAYALNLLPQRIGGKEYRCDFTWQILKLGVRELHLACAEEGCPVELKANMATMLWKVTAINLHHNHKLWSDDAFPLSKAAPSPSVKAEHPPMTSNKSTALIAKAKAGPSSYLRRAKPKPSVTSPVASKAPEVAAEEPSLDRTWSATAVKPRKTEYLVPREVGPIKGLPARFPPRAGTQPYAPTATAKRSAEASSVNTSVKGGVQTGTSQVEQSKASRPIPSDLRKAQTDARAGMASSNRTQPAAHSISEPAKSAVPISSLPWARADPPFATTAVLDTPPSPSTFARLSSGSPHGRSLGYGKASKGNSPQQGPSSTRETERRRISDEVVPYTAKDDAALADFAALYCFKQLLSGREVGNTTSEAMLTHFMQDSPEAARHSFASWQARLASTPNVKARITESYELLTRYSTASGPSCSSDAPTSGAQKTVISLLSDDEEDAVAASLSPKKAAAPSVIVLSGAGLAVPANAGLPKEVEQAVQTIPAPSPSPFDGSIPMELESSLPPEPVLPPTPSTPSHPALGSPFADEKAAESPVVEDKDVSKPPAVVPTLEGNNVDDSSDAPWFAPTTRSTTGSATSVAAMSVDPESKPSIKRGGRSYSVEDDKWMAQQIFDLRNAHDTALSLCQAITAVAVCQITRVSSLYESRAATRSTAYSGSVRALASCVELLYSPVRSWSSHLLTTVNARKTITEHVLELAHDAGPGADSEAKACLRSFGLIDASNAFVPYTSTRKPDYSSQIQETHGKRKTPSTSGRAPPSKRANVASGVDAPSESQLASLSTAIDMLANFSDSTIDSVVLAALPNKLWDLGVVSINDMRSLAPVEMIAVLGNCDIDADSARQLIIPLKLSTFEAPASDSSIWHDGVTLKDFLGSLHPLLEPLGSQLFHCPDGSAKLLKDWTPKQLSLLCRHGSAILSLACNAILVSYPHQRTLTESATAAFSRLVFLEPSAIFQEELVSRMAATELSLLDSTWRAADENLSPAQKLAKAAVEGRFVDVLTSTTCRKLALFVCEGHQAEIRWPADATSETELAVLSVAVSLLHAFVQINWTGPEMHVTPNQLFECDVDETALNVSSAQALTLLSEPVYHLSRHLTFFLLAVRLLDNTRWKHTPTQPIWRLRAALMHLRLLDEPVPLPQKILDDATAAASAVLTNEPDLSAGVLLTLGQYHALASRAQPYFDKKASELFHEAASRSGFEYELTGRLGKRTRFQEKDTSQLVVLARSRQRDSWSARSSRETNGHAEEPNTLALNDDTLLEKTRFTSSAASETRWPLSDLLPDQQPPLHPLDQCILLGLSINIGNSAPTHGLTSHQIGAFVARVLEDVENWSVHSMALLLRSRLESSRTRTVERGLLQMQSLVDQLKLSGTTDELASATNERGADATERLAFIHALAVPPRWALEAELARRYRGLGVTRSALEIYERLELWEDAALCHASTGRKDRAVALILDLLQGKKLDAEAETPAARRAVPEAARAAKLWCTLGDLEGDPAHYEKAWQVSGGSSSRAMRGLGAHQFKAGQWAEARDSLQKALAINPLFMKTWFVLGCAALQAEDWPCAEEAFGRCVSLDDEDGESWSNLASVHLRIAEDLGKAGDKGSALKRKRAAHACLRQATKHAYESWRIWQNLLTSSLAIGELADAVWSLSRIIEIRAAKAGVEVDDLDALDMLVDVSLGREGTNGIADSSSEASSAALAPRLRDLFDKSLLPVISDNARVHRTHARFLLGQGDAKASLAAHLLAYRHGSAQSPAAEHDRKAFLESCKAVQDTVDALETLGEREQDGARVCSDWRYQARSIVRSFLGRTKSAFEDEPEYERLRDVMKSIR